MFDVLLSWKEKIYCIKWIWLVENERHSTLLQRNKRNAFVVSKKKHITRVFHQGQLCWDSTRLRHCFVNALERWGRRHRPLCERWSLRKPSLNSWVASPGHRISCGNRSAAESVELKYSWSSLRSAGCLYHDWRWPDWRRSRWVSEWVLRIDKLSMCSRRIALVSSHERDSLLCDWGIYRHGHGFSCDIFAWTRKDKRFSLQNDVHRCIQNCLTNSLWRHPAFGGQDWRSLRRSRDDWSWRRLKVGRRVFH